MELDVSRIVEEALEGLHELIAHGYLRGGFDYVEDPKRKVAHSPFNSTPPPPIHLHVPPSDHPPSLLAPAFPER